MMSGEGKRTCVSYWESLSEHGLGSEKTVRAAANVLSRRALCFAKPTCVVVCVYCGVEGLLLSLSGSILQGDPWLSHQQILCRVVCVCVLLHVRLRELFVLIRIKELFSKGKI